MYKCTRYMCLETVLFYGTFLHIVIVLSAFFLCPKNVQKHFYVLDQEQKRTTFVLIIYELNSLIVYY
jgi:hypothetical protein